MFLGHHKTVLFMGVTSIHFRSFSEGQGTELDFFFFFFFFGEGGLLNYKYFWGKPDFFVGSSSPFTHSFFLFPLLSFFSFVVVVIFLDIFLVVFFGVCLIFLGVNSRCWVQASVSRKND